MIKFVLDTNVLVSALISRKKFGFTKEEVNTIIESIISFSEVVNSDIKLDVIRSDPDDNKILECAVACGAFYVVSGDRHLLDLKEYLKIKIITPKAALDMLKT